MQPSRLRPLSPGLLLWIHLVVPVCVSVAVIDATLLGGVIRNWLPTHPDALIGFTIVFNLPHIIASELILLDAEYRRAYGRLALVVIAATVLASLALPLMLPKPVFLLLLLTITLVHVIGQQTGIATMLAGVRVGASAWAWRWGCTLLALLVYVPWTPDMGIAEPNRPGSDLTVMVVIAAVTVPATVLHRRATKPFGRVYLWATHAVLVAMAGLAMGGYPCLALLVPRVVHDFTAWAFYLVHDVNRNREVRRNVVYRALAFTGIPVWLLGPVLAIAIAYTIERGLPLLVAALVVGTLSMLHYVLEAVTWRRNGLYRAWVPLALDPARVPSRRGP